MIHRLLDNKPFFLVWLVSKWLVSRVDIIFAGLLIKILNVRNVANKHIQATASAEHFDVGCGKSTLDCQFGCSLAIMLPLNSA